MTRKLLSHYEISSPLKAYHAHNEHTFTRHVLEDLASGKTVALVSDAGTPGISDPGFLLVNACLEQEIPFSCLPGASAMIPAFVMSGLPLHEFLFAGFFPKKKGRQSTWQRLSQHQSTWAFYESPHRLLKALTECNEHCGSERDICVVREISKIHEEVKRGPAEVVLQYYQAHPDKCVGEIVIVVSGKD
jgi:16S rRNA (cytidine1402-2'-O)-methyltransferase